MDLYHVWCDLKPGVADLEFAEKIGAFMGQLRQRGVIEAHRLTRCKLGLCPPGMGEWHIMIEVRDLHQLQDAFELMASRREPAEGVHFGVNSLVRNPVFALYRDFPDAVRQRGEERF